MGQISYRSMRSWNYLIIEIRKAHEIIAGVFDLSFQWFIWNVPSFIRPSISKNAVLCLLWIYRILIKIFCLPFPPFFIWFLIQATKIRNFRKPTKFSLSFSTYHTDLHESFLSSLGKSVVCCPLSVVKFQKSVSIREIRGASFANFASLREPPPCRFARYAEPLWNFNIRFNIF